MALWAYKKVQNFKYYILASTIKTFNSRTSINPLINLNFLFFFSFFFCCSSVQLSSFIKIFANLWKWFEFIHYSFLVNRTCLSTMPLHTHILAIKNGRVLHTCIQFICMGQQGYKTFELCNVRIYISNISLEKYILVKVEIHYHFEERFGS